MKLLFPLAFGTLVLGLAVSFPRAQDSPAEPEKVPENAESDATKPAAGETRPEGDIPDVKELPAGSPANSEAKGTPDATSDEDDGKPMILELKRADGRQCYQHPHEPLPRVQGG